VFRPGTMAKTVQRKRRTQGMNWCRPTTRLALYLRDGLACAWCGAGVEHGAQLTLDHIVPYASGGSNAPRNLVTACMTCNRNRGERSLVEFAVVVAGYLDHGVTPDEILAHVTKTRKRALPRRTAIALLKQRSNVSEAARLHASTTRG
jgi:HNH endonuclease